MSENRYIFLNKYLNSKKIGSILQGFMISFQLFNKISTLIIVLLLFCPIKMLACDVCGCSVNANYFGILPQFNKNFIGVRLTQSNFELKHTPTLFPKSNTYYEEQLNRYEIWGRFYVTDRFVIFGSLPYQNNKRTDAGIKQSYQGISDATLSTNYILFNTGDSTRLLVRNTLMVGIGLKFPTGSFKTNKPVSLQTGTGTWDYYLNLIYTMRYKNLGFNTDATYRINSMNQSYQYGNRFISSARLFYWKKKSGNSILPNAGLLYEYSLKDKSNKIPQLFTGGMGVYFAGGVDLYVGRFALGLNMTLPISESLNNGYANTQNRLSTQIIYLF
jgi:hypothetical protein